MPRETKDWDNLRKVRIEYGKQLKSLEIEIAAIKADSARVKRQTKGHLQDNAGKLLHYKRAKAKMEKVIEELDNEINGG